MGEVAGSGPFEEPGERIREARDWLSYYSECRQYELVMGQKFTSLLGQASVFSFAAATAVVTLAERLQVGFPLNLAVAVPSTIGLSMYAAIILKYFLQIRYTGRILLRIERRILGGDASSLGLLHVLRNPRSRFYGARWTFGLVWAYAAILIALPWAAVLSTRWSPAVRSLLQE